MAIARPASTARSSEPSASAPIRRAPSGEEIAQRAYFIALEQGGGDELANWLRAEQELTTA